MIPSSSFKPSIPPKPKFIGNINLNQPVARPHPVQFSSEPTISGPFDSNTVAEPEFFGNRERSRNDINGTIARSRPGQPSKKAGPVTVEKICELIRELEKKNSSSQEGQRTKIDHEVEKHSIDIRSKICVFEASTASIKRTEISVMVDYTDGSSKSTSSSSISEGFKPEMSEPRTDAVDQILSSKPFKIAQEIAMTESDYLDSLKLVLVDLPVFVKGTVPDEELAALFIELSGLSIFSADLSNDLKNHVENYPSHQEIAPVFLKKGHFLGLYVEYIKNFEKLIDRYRELIRNHPRLAEKIQEFQASPACKKIPLVEYFHKPVQRLPRYPLLLGTYLRALPEDHPDRENTKRALDLVSDWTTKANTSLSETERVSKLLWYQSRTVGYTFLKSNRTYIRDGQLKKLSRKAPQDRVVILCSDALICGEYDSVLGTAFNVKAEYSLSDIFVDDLQDFDRNFNLALEFGIRNPTKSSVFQASKTEERKAWIEAIQRAKSQYLKLLQRGVTTNITPQADTPNRPLAPIWIPDYRVKACSVCAKEFNMIRRYHHCRKCGAAVCSACSPHEIAIDYKENRPKRVCIRCFRETSASSSTDDLLLTA